MGAMENGETHFLKSATLEANGVLHLRYGSFGVEPGSMVDAPITRIGKNEIWFEESGETGRIVRSLLPYRRHRRKSGHDTAFRPFGGGFFRRQVATCVRAPGCQVTTLSGQSLATDEYPL